MTRVDELLECIRMANQDRRKDLLKVKYEAMTEGPFRFYRATPYLFYKDWPIASYAKEHPNTWVCGDLHLENFGSFKGQNRLVYFDINDFDEALLAPCTADIGRLVTSLFLAGAPKLLNYPVETSRFLAQQFLAAYTKMLLQGKPRSIERETADGVLKQFLAKVAKQTRADLIERYTRGTGLKRKIVHKQIHPLVGEERESVRNWLTTALREQDGYELRDVALRIAGTSSIGLNRYVALAKGPTGKLHLLDVKATRPSVAEPYVGISQPSWSDEATRVVTLQNRLQDVPPANLWSMKGPNDEYFVVRYLQPQADRLKAKRIRAIQQLLPLIETMAQLTASAHLRSGGREGSATADQLIDFANQSDWAPELLGRAESYALQVYQDYAQFKAAFKAGWFTK
ncbi:DUF2252 domain-containing protein [Spirosoma foliorum]|uniref:DUF2252 family protein n=1 Tax=Spirosoma foliorum TaxID=2710596 RepID=A0A7G5H0F4_9BACT|nr:DUF2252 family protein [Spirosoma foliorum]QMW04596.1 DUF2252 family protein [Spirosoma foliorum]